MTFLPAYQFFYVYERFNGVCGCLAKIIKNLDLIHNKEAFPVTSFKKKLRFLKCHGVLSDKELCLIICTLLPNILNFIPAKKKRPKLL